MMETIICMTDPKPSSHLGRDQYTGCLTKAKSALTNSCVFVVKAWTIGKVSHPGVPKDSVTVEL